MQSTDPTWPLLLTGPDDATTLVRVPLMSPAFNEARLQELLRLHPEALPIAELDPSFAPAICIGREVPTGAGPLDNLYISPSGGLTIVETKLWKNPEARRTVVAQLLDYTKGLARWTYSDLDRTACAYLQAHGFGHDSLYGFLEAKVETMSDEQTFIDRVGETLRHGRFLLLVVGDGIRHGAQEMVEYIQETPQLQFRLALVELACYRQPGQEWPLTMVPRVVVRTAEVERAVVRMDIPPDIAARLGITVTTPARPVTTSPGEQGFFEELEGNVGREATEAARDFIEAAKGLAPNLRVHSTKRLLYIEVLADEDDDSAAGRAMLLRRDGIFRPQPAARLRHHGVPTTILERYWREMGAISPAFEQTKSAIGNDLGKRLSISELGKHKDAILAVLKRLADAVAASRDE